MLQEIPGHSREGGLEGDCRPAMFGCLLEEHRSVSAGGAL